MTGTELRVLLDATLVRWEKSRDELRRLDAALGDGDLGITVAAGAAEIRDALALLPAEPAPRDVLKTAGTKFAVANPSTFAALVGAGLLAAAGAVDGADRLDRAQVLALGRAASDRIAARGKAQLGDKTVLDALVPSLDALEAAGSDPRPALDAMIRSARDGVQATTPMRSQRGRAAWVQDRSEGEPDPGATAYLRFLEALADTWDHHTEATL